MESKERISIKNFAGIEKLEMDIKPINILIGPQGVGKSVVVKLIYFFRDVIEELVEVEKPLDVNTKSALFTFSKIFEHKNISKPFEIVYTGKTGYALILTGNEDGGLSLDVSDEVVSFIVEKDEIRKRFDSDNIGDIGVQEFLKIEKEVKETFKQKFEEEFSERILEQLFVPAGRSFFSTVHKNVYSVFEKEASALDIFLLRFGNIYQILGRINLVYDFDENEDVEREKFNDLIYNVIGGEYFIDYADKEYIIHDDDRKIEVKNVSSGQQEALPLLLILKAIYNKRLAKEGSRLYIEEPEAHLFPTAQKAIVELLAKTYNSNPDNTQLFITTHSPYILTSFNNLIYAGNIIKQDTLKRDAVEKVVDRDTLLDYSQIGAYAVTKGGIKDLIDQENHIINAELLDEVSNTIGREFDQLLDIEYAE